MQQSPQQEYRGRLDRWRLEKEGCAARHHRLGNLRLATGIAAVVIASIGFGPGWISAWWLLAPLAAFLALAVALDRTSRTIETATRGEACYERAVARLEGRWIGLGDQGERFRDPRHIYADDLDLFGRGSLFELLSTARTGAGHRTLANWLLAPASRADALGRQAAVAELRPRIDLREDIALMGEDIRAAVDDQALREWGTRPRLHFFPGARVIAFLLGAAAAVTFFLFMGEVVTLLPFLLVVLAQLIFGYFTRDSVHAVRESVDTPARDLELLGLLLARLERESFHSPALAQLRASLEAAGQPASRQIQRVARLVHHFDSARNLFLAAIATPLLWVPQFAMAIEAWRAQCGPRIGIWVQAVADFEALSSLAGFAYERPDSIFPELLDDSRPSLEAASLAHPLIAASHAVGNDVALGGETRLWIVSGSNMSGKSTLLRAVGLGVAMAWAGAPVTAARMRVSRLHAGASMRANDSLADNRSRFYAEITRLREIADLAKSGQPALFLLDELLSGTNSHDRRIGAEALVRGLVERGAIGLLTTHDLALAEIAAGFGGAALNVHFEDHLEGGEIRFDYRLRQGVVTRSNALELMRAVGLEV